MQAPSPTMNQRHAEDSHTAPCWSLSLPGPRSFTVRSRSGGRCSRRTRHARTGCMRSKSASRTGSRSEVPTEMPTNERSTATAAAISRVGWTIGRGHDHQRHSRIGLDAHPGRVLRGQRVQVPPRAEEGDARTARRRRPSRSTSPTSRRRLRRRPTASAFGGRGARTATWIAPDNPRWQFAKQLNAVPVLYKVYVATPLPETDASDRVHEDDSVTKAFVAAAWTQFAAAFGGK